MHGTVLAPILAQAFINHLFVQQGDDLKMNLNLEDVHNDCIDLLKEPAREKQTMFKGGKSQVKKKKAI